MRKRGLLAGAVLLIGQPVQAQPTSDGDTVSAEDMRRMRAELDALREQMNEASRESQEKLDEAKRLAEMARADLEDARREREAAEKAAQAEAPTEGAEAEEDPLRFYGDMRFRTEGDWNSRLDDGSYRRDRFRFRYRVRLGFAYQADEHWSFGARTRTGVPTNLQSPHVNVGWNGLASAPLNIARAYVAADYGEVWGWVGKNGFPGYRQDELFWDDDVTPEGIALGGRIPLGDDATLKPTAAYFVPDHEQIVAYPDSRMFFAQLHLNAKPSDWLHLDVASTYAHMDDIFVVPQHLTRDLYDQGGDTPDRLDYRFLYHQLRLTFRAKVGSYDLPVVVGASHNINLQQYDDAPEVPEHYRDQRNMFVGMAQVGHAANIGGKSKFGDWLFAIYGVQKEQLSVVSYFTEDDWVRWGNIDRNRNVNYRGIELRGHMAFGPHLNVMARYYNVRGLVPRLENDATTTETGQRFRIEVNARF